MLSSLHDSKINDLFTLLIKLTDSSEMVYYILIFALCLGILLRVMSPLEQENVFITLVRMLNVAEFILHGCILL